MVLEGVPLGLADLSAYGLLVVLIAFMLISLFRGWIIVKVHYEVLLKANDEQRETILILRDTNAIQARTIEKQTAVGDTVVKVVSSIQEARVDGSPT